MDDSDALRNELNRQKRTAGVVTALWLALLGGMFVWQATQYHGFVELLAEWQYRVLDHYYPGITIALLSLFFSVPLLAMLFILWRRWRAKNERRAIRWASCSAHHGACGGSAAFWRF